MKGDPKVIEYLNAGLRHELTAVNQYWLHYRLLDNWGYKSLAKYWRKESIEEMEHAAEHKARDLYQEAATHCHAVKDYVTRDLFEKLMHDEEKHIDFLETQLDLVDKLGIQLYSQYHIGGLESDKD